CRSATSASSATAVPAFVTTALSTRTWPARIKARARSRVGARPRVTRSTSSLDFAITRPASAVVGRSRPAGEAPCRDLAKTTAKVRLVERSLGPLNAVGRHLTGLLQAIERWKRRFASRSILPRSLAEIGSRAGHIEHVINDLKRQTDLRGVTID